MINFIHGAWDLVGLLLLAAAVIVWTFILVDMAIQKIKD